MANAIKCDCCGERIDIASDHKPTCRRPIRGWYPPADLPDEDLDAWRAAVPEHHAGSCRKQPWCRAKTHHPDCPLAGVK